MLVEEKLEISYARTKAPLSLGLWKSAGSRSSHSKAELMWRAVATLR